MSAHRYWRIRFRAGAPSNEVDLGWVKFWDTVDITGSTTVASTGGTAISGENFSGSYLPAKSFNYANAETSDQWASTNNAATWGTTKWIGYDFGAGNEKEIVAYSFTPYSSTYAPSAWDFEYSDDNSSWTSVHTVNGWNWELNGSAFFRCPTTVGGSGYRYWRIYADGTGTVQSVSELSMRLTSGGSNLLSTYSSVLADSANGASFTSYGPRKVFDGNTGFLSYSWRSDTGTGGHYWEADFGKKVDLAEVVLTCGPKSEWRGNVKLQASNDRSTWTDKGTFSAPTADYQAQTLTVTAPAVLTRRRPLIICT